TVFGPFRGRCGGAAHPPRGAALVPTASAPARILYVNRFADGVFRGFHHRLPEGGVGVNRESHVRSIGTHFDCEGTLRDQIARLGSHDVDAEDPLVFGIDDGFDEPFGLVDRHRAS